MSWVDDSWEALVSDAASRLSACIEEGRVQERRVWSQCLYLLAEVQRTGKPVPWRDTP